MERNMSQSHGNDLELQSGDGGISVATAMERSGMAHAPDRGCREANGVEKYSYYLRISNLEVFIALGKIQQLLDDPIFKNGVGSKINSVIPENTSST